MFSNKHRYNAVEAENVEVEMVESNEKIPLSGVQVPATERLISFTKTNALYRPLLVLFGIVFVTMLYLSYTRVSTPVGTPTEEAFEGYNFEPTAAGCVSTCTPNAYILALQYWTGAKTNPSIHGLWANPKDICTTTESKTKCCGDPFDLSKLQASTKNNLYQYWTGGTNTCGGKFKNSVEGFWCHEWQNHGVCTGMDQDTYFAKTIALYQANNKLTTCASGGNCYVCYDGSLGNPKKC